jgi:type I restriction enzyme S subunit
MSDDATLDEFADSGKTGTNQEVPPPTELTGVTDDWANVRLAKVAKSDDGAFVDGPFGSNLKADEMHTEGYARVIQLQNIRESEFVDTNHRYISEEKFEELSRHGAEAGDLAIAKMSEPVARACLLPDIEDQYLVVADCIKLSVDESAHNSQFVMLTLNSRSVWKQAFARSRGSTRKRINLTQLKEVQIPSPPLSEQRKIATVLHTVDQAIQKTKEIVEQNRQLKLGVVQDLFSNGFTNETSRSKWFGTVPSDWEVDRLDELAHVTKLAGYEYTNDFDYDKEGDIIAVRALNLKGNRLNLDNEIKYITQKSADELERSKLSEGDIAMTYVGAYIGESSYIPESDKFTLGPNVAKMSPNERLMGKYLHQALQTKQLKTQIKARQSSTGQPALSMSKIRKLEIPLPHLEQQENIVEVLEKFDRRHMHKTDVIDQYQSLKRGLMQDLLSGEVRTTDAKIKIPEEVAKYG